MTDVPELTLVTNPEVPIVATPVVPLAHVPPDEPSEREVDAPTHTENVPVMEVTGTTVNEMFVRHPVLKV